MAGLARPHDVAQQIRASLRSTSREELVIATKVSLLAGSDHQLPHRGPSTHSLRLPADREKPRDFAACSATNRTNGVLKGSVPPLTTGGGAWSSGLPGQGMCSRIPQRLDVGESDRGLHCENLWAIATIIAPVGCRMLDLPGTPCWLSSTPDGSIENSPGRLTRCAAFGALGLRPAAEILFPLSTREARTNSDPGEVLSDPGF